MTQAAAPIDIYARVSHKGDKQQRSTGGQVQECKGILAERDLSVGQVHVDDGRSAWNPQVKRPGWDTLMGRLESGESGGVIVFDLERFSRRPVEGERLITAAERGLVVLDSDGEFDLATASGKKSFRDALNAAAYYSDRLHDRVTRGKRLKARKGEVDARRSFGFEADGVTVREDEAAVIRECADRLLGGETQESVMADLRARGVPTVRGAAWGYTTFRQVMTRPRNAGYIVHNGEVVDGVRLPGEPILDEPIWRRIVALYASRRPGRPPSGRYLLTGIAVCGQCGAPLAGRPVTGTRRRQYWCKKCRKTFADVRPLEAYASILAAQILGDPHHAAAIERAARETADERGRIEHEIASIEELATAMAERLGRGEITLTRYDVVTKPLDMRLQKLHSQLDALGSREAAPVPQGSVQEWEHRYEAADPGQRRAIVLDALRGRKLVVGPGQPARFDPERVTVR
ncbi:MAG: recombinase family protein [Streptosporangiaceae bacterium]